jgi:nucleoid-associated protein YgaU
MNTSYKIALGAAVVLCVLVIGYSVLVPGGDGETTDPSAVDTQTLPTERLAEVTPQRPPLEMSSQRPATPSSEPTAQPTSEETARNNDLLSRVLSINESASPPASAREDDVPTPGNDTPAGPALAAANQPGDIEDEPASPSTITFGGQEPPAIPSSPTTLTPRSSTPPPVVIGPGTTSPPTSTAPATPLNANTYTIQSGDTFASIAIALYRDESKWVDIAQANPMVDPRKLRIGQVIRLPSETELREAIAPPAPPQGAGTTYVVREGDTLSSIAQRFYNDRNLWEHIHRANRESIGSDPNRIAAGDKLLIPPKP